MKRTSTFFCLVISLIALCFTGCGYGGTETPVSKGEDSLEAESFVGEGYTLARDAKLVTLGADQGEVILELLAGQTLAVIERRSDDRIGNLVRLGIDVEEESGLPSDVWVRESDLPNADLIPEVIDQGSEAGEVGAELGTLKKMTYCYRYVKLYLMKTGKVKTYLPGGRAFQAASILPRYGFRRTGRRPSGAQNGEVCVYSGGPQGHGHIEVKRSGMWWYGYGFINHPIQNRRFIACFVK